MTTAEQIQGLFQNQLSAHAEEIARKIKEKHGDVEGLDTTIQEYLASANLNMDAKPTKTKSKSKSTPKEPKAKKERSPEDRCQARVWGDGDGTAQCSFGAGVNGSQRRRLSGTYPGPGTDRTRPLANDLVA